MYRLVLAILLFLPAAAHAAAWTQGAGSGQAITSLLFTGAGHSFGADGRAGTPTRFQRMLLQTDTSYGWRDSVTFLVRSETAMVRLGSGAGARSAVSNALEVGARTRLGTGVLRDNDIVSVEGTLRAAGAFNFYASADGQAGGRAGGMRLLYGMPYKLEGRDGFLDVEVGKRWLTPPRPGETAIDLTGGLWLTPADMVMLQNFNLISTSDRRPDMRFRSHKIQASYVRRWSSRWLMQTGAYFSPAGANALQESGLVVSLWANF
jgi:hypothetical protein